MSLLSNKAAKEQPAQPVLGWADGAQAAGLGRLVLQFGTQLAVSLVGGFGHPPSRSSSFLYARARWYSSHRRALRTSGDLPSSTHRGESQGNRTFGNPRLSVGRGPAPGGRPKAYRNPAMTKHVSIVNPESM